MRTPVFIEIFLIVMLSCAVLTASQAGVPAFKQIATPNKDNNYFIYILKNIFFARLYLSSHVFFLSFYQYYLSLPLIGNTLHKTIGPRRYPRYAPLLENLSYMYILYINE